MSNITQVFPQYTGDALSRDLDPAAFDAAEIYYQAYHESFVGIANPWADQANSLKDDMNLIASGVQTNADVAVQAKDDAETAAFNAQSASNYQGDWSLTPPLPAIYPYPQGVSVTVGDVFYYSKIDNNTDVPPSVNWQKTISVITPPTTTPTSVTSAQNKTTYLDIDDWQENYIYNVNNVNPTESQAVVVGNQVAITTQNVVASSVSTVQLNVTIPNIGTSEYTNITVNLNYIPIEADGIINNADYSANESANTNFDYIAGGMESNADSAIYTENITSQGSLTISNPTTTSVQVVEDVTGLDTLYILNTENTSDYLAVTVDNITGSVGSQVIDFTTAGLVSATTDASSETKWSNQNSTALLYDPKGIIIDGTSDATDLVTYTPISTGEDTTRVKSDNSYIQGALSTVSELSINDFGIDRTSSPSWYVTYDLSTASGNGQILSLYAKFKTGTDITTLQNIIGHYDAVNDNYLSIKDGEILIDGYPIGYSSYNKIETTNASLAINTEYELVVQIDTTVPSIKFYLNDVLLSTTTTHLTQNANFMFLNTSKVHGVGTRENGINPFFGRIANIQIIGDKKLKPSSFDQGFYRGEYGTSDICLRFENNLDDSSGNGNNAISNSGTAIYAIVGTITKYTVAHGLGELPVKTYFNDDIDVYIDVQNTASQINMPANGIQMTKGILTYDGTKFTQPFADMTLPGRAIQREIRASKAETKIYEPLNTTMYKEGS